MPSTLDELLANTDRAGDCWLWTGTTVHGGYGQARWNGEPHQAHRLVYELTVGPIPDGLMLDHLCRVRHCVNPAHLEPVTSHENILRGQVPTANRTRCKNDRHDLDQVGVYIDSSGCHRCAACRAESKARHRARQAARPAA